MWKWIILIVVVSFSEVNAQNQERVPSRLKYHLSVCSLLKNDAAPWLVEWIEYHRLIGVDHFYLYSSTNDAATKRALSPYVRMGVVSLIPWIVKSEESEEVLKQSCFALGVETTAYEHAIYTKATQETLWMVCLGLTEYLLPVAGDHVLNILHKYKDAPGIVISSDCFDASRTRYFSHHQLVIENTGLISPPRKLSTPTSKLIFKPSLCEGFTWPPYQCTFKHDLRPIQVSRSEIRLNFYKPRELAHLEFRRRFSVDNRVISRTELSEILSMGYEVEDQEQEIQRFVPRLRQIMSPGVPVWVSGR